MLLLCSKCATATHTHGRLHSVCSPPLTGCFKTSICVCCRANPKTLYADQKYSYEVYKQVRRKTCAEVLLSDWLSDWQNSMRCFTLTSEHRHLVILC